MKATSLKTCTTVFGLGLALGLSSPAHSGGDPCAPFGGETDHYDQLSLSLSAVTVDDVPQPVDSWYSKTGNLRSVIDYQLTDQLTAVLPDLSPVSTDLRFVWARRVP